MKRKKCFTAVVLFLILTLLTPAVVSAYTPYEGYQYNSKGDVVPAPASYVPSFTYVGADAGGFNAPEDLYVDRARGEIYVVDTGNNRIVVLDETFVFQREYRTFLNSGTEETLLAPAGIFVAADGTMYITDRDHARVLVADQQGTVKKLLSKPETEFAEQTAEYAPEKIVVDSVGRIYVQARGMYQGILCMDENGKFLQFFGGNRVELTATVVLERLWKSLMTKSQRETFSDFVPIEYANIFIDGEDFVYSVVKNSENQKEQIKKLNSKGLNILRVNENALLANGRYGDPTRVQTSGAVLASGANRTTKTSTAFADIHVDEQGFLYALDQTHGRVFVYDQDSNPLTIFGGMGTQQGLFSSPTAVESVGKQIIVLDAKKNSLTVFNPTDFGNWMKKAILLYNDGLYVQSQEPWNEVLKRDMNNELAYIGIGKALYGMKEYEDALRYFELGYDKAGYSKAFKEYRNGVVRENFGGLFFTLAALLVLLWLLKRGLAPRWDKIKNVGWFQKLTLPFHTMIHPFDGYERLKWNGQGSVFVASGVLLVWFLLTILNRQWTGFIFAPVGSEEFNSLFLFAGTVLLFLVAVVANWSISTLIDCEGKFHEIFTSCAYALLPILVVDMGNIILSHFLVMEEGVLMTALRGLAIVWSIILLELAFMTIHQISLKKALVLTLATLLGMAIILFIVMLLFSLCQQVTSFVYNLYNEIRFRL